MMYWSYKMHRQKVPNLVSYFVVDIYSLVPIDYEVEGG